MSQLSRQQAFATNLGGTPWGMANYHPPLMRPTSDRVGDVGFYTKVGKWRSICNAFDSTSLARWNLPAFQQEERSAVTETFPAERHFKLAAGWRGKVECKQVGLDCSLPVPVVPGLDTGCTLSLELAEESGSFSVLVPGQGPLTQRACLAQSWWDLLAWFSKIEARVWVAVNAYLGGERPDNIFLITGQTLTGEYSISHQDTLATRCKVYVEGHVDLQSIIQASTFYGYDLEQVKASSGFEHSVMGSPGVQSRLYSIYFETIESSPMRRFNFFNRRSHRLRQIESAHRYFEKVAKGELSGSLGTKSVQDLGPEVERTFGRLRAWLSGSRTYSYSTPERVLMDSENYYWWLIRLAPGDYAVQYTGPDPAIHFPPSLTDNGLLELVTSFYHSLRQNIDPASRNPFFSKLLRGLDGGLRTTAQQGAQRNLQVKRDCRSSEPNPSFRSPESDTESISFGTSHLYKDDEMPEGEPTQYESEFVTGSHGSLDNGSSLIDPLNTSDLVPSPAETRALALGRHPMECQPNRMSKPTLGDLLKRHDLAISILYYLDFKATMSLQQLFPLLKSVCMSHILHDIIPETHIVMTTARTGEAERSTNSDLLYPVIARIRREDRVLPPGLIVYEPEQKSSRPKEGHFITTSLRVCLPECGQRFTWKLEYNSPDGLETSRHLLLSERHYFVDHYRFADSQRPQNGLGEQFYIKVFYKRQEELLGSYQLHALSLPFDCLMDRLSTELQIPSEYHLPRRGMEGTTAFQDFNTGREMKCVIENSMNTVEDSTSRLGKLHLKADVK